jgi:hypothetical protein
MFLNDIEALFTGRRRVVACRLGSTVKVPFLTIGFQSHAATLPDERKID